MTKHLSLRFATLALTLCSALSACVIRTSGPYDDCDLDPQYCGGGAIGCFVDDDCPTGLVCDRVSSSCVPTSTCHSGQKCPTATHCDARQTCVPDGWGTGGVGGRGGAGGRGGSSTGSGGVGTGGAAGANVGTSTGGAIGNHGTGTGGMTGQPGAGGTTGSGIGGAAGAGTGSAGAGGSVPGCLPG